ncbi:MAG: tetratricopeptide repeat protein [Oleiphilaceae bacterium]|nr:tetratricopeptide repeat protein [Oleiphilaceae bacterium]
MNEHQLRKLCQNSKFLILDDFENFRTSLRLMLKSFGAAFVDTVANAEQALNQAKYDSYDIILCDFNLGAGKNGQQILEELRMKKRIKHTSLFVMVTADTSKETVLGTREFQPDAYIAKPVTRNMLEERLLQLMTQQAILKPINREIDIDNYAKAISLCKQEIENGTRYRSWCLQTMASLYRKLGDTSSAQGIYKEVLSQRHIDWAQLGLAHTLLDTTQYDQAKQVFSQVIEKSPMMVEAYEGVSDACLHLGQRQEAQEALQEAVTISPRMVKRQSKLASLCVENNDLRSASEAFRKAITFGENTVHETPTLYLDFGRCLSDLSIGDTTNQGNTLANEANIQLETILDKFSYEEEACHCANLVKARVLIGRDKHEQAQLLIDEVQSLIDVEDLSVDLGLELSRSLYTAGRQDEAENLLIKLSQKFESAPQALGKIEALLDEPEPFELRIKAKSLNKTGIQLFESGQLQSAVESFTSALALTPKHAALNLNLAQVALKLYKDESSPNTLNLAQECIERIQHIPKQHKQFRRLQHIKKNVQNILRENQI